jgi:hypothetical protein
MHCTNSFYRFTYSFLNAENAHLINFVAIAVNSLVFMAMAMPMPWTNVTEDRTS